MRRVTVLTETGNRLRRRLCRHLNSLISGVRMFSTFTSRQAIACTTLLIAAAAPACASERHDQDDRRGNIHGAHQTVQLGPRPFFLVDDMQAGTLKRKLQACANGPFRKSDFSIGHRGAALQFPEHTRESYMAAARMGAGIVECDVTITQDKQLVCRHAQNDL
ncbi:MAG TPA: glycerophosphodiester phosphodiesterase family protein, partial [Rhizobiaceae bacterium]|nr:glycerophosphodiester phosphodiesterase family protein [Rhizobiaceae bacterium]